MFDKSTLCNHEKAQNFTEAFTEASEAPWLLHAGPAPVASETQPPSHFRGRLTWDSADGDPAVCPLYLPPFLWLLLARVTPIVRVSADIVTYTCHLCLCTPDMGTHIAPVCPCE